MACPLSFILNGNSSNQPLPEARNQDETDNEEDDEDTTGELVIRIRCQNLSSQSSQNSNTGFAVAHPERNFSPQSRPASRGSNRRPTFLTSPSGSPPPGWVESEPPAYELDFAKFSVFNALFNHPTLVLEITEYLDVDDLVLLYSVSRDFHDLANARFTSMVMAQATKKAPESSQIFYFRYYRSLCQTDPAARASEKIPDQVRDVPTFRWLRMVLFREAIVDQIIECLAAEGHFMPKRASLTIRKLWFILDIGTNWHRTAAMHSTEFWTNEDLYLATMFFVKLDMRFTHPVAGNGERGMRQMLLGQRSLSTLCRVLMRQELRSQLELLRMIVQWDYVPAPAHRELSIFGVPACKVGRTQYEKWGRGTEPFVLIDRLVMLEAIKRDLDIHTHYLDMILYGYVDKDTFQDVWHSSQKPPHDGDDEDGENGSGEQELGQQ